MTAGAWIEAARDPVIAGELEAVYEQVARAIAQRGPICRASGRCCNFERWGHRLYVTGLEAAYTLTRLGEEQAVSVGDIADARERGGCPFQVGMLCSVHGIKPLGCRTYYCDPTAREWQELLTERSLAEVRAIHERYEIPYRYGEWREILELLLSDDGL